MVVIAIIGMLLVFIGRVILVRYITQSEYGIFSLALVLMSIFAMISTLGLQSGVTRQIAYFRGKKDSEKVRGIVKSSIQIDVKTISLYGTELKNVVVI